LDWIRRREEQVKFARKLMTACAAGALLTAAAAAQDETSDQIYMEADELVEDGERGVYIARGDVRLQTNLRVLYADELIYDPETGRITAQGNVRLFEGSQPAQFADEIILDDDMEEGVAYGFATLLENNGRAAAAAALRRPDGSVDLRDAFYTSCDLCVEGEREPTWRLRADQVIRDQDDEVIRYRDMSLELGGVPIFYTPYFAHADPAAKRRSGFLLPAVDISNRLGVSYQQPYYWNIGPYQDLVIAPRVMSEVNPLLELDYRRRFYSGAINIEASFTFEQEYRIDPDERGNDDAEADWMGDTEFRGHIFADGRFSLSESWAWGFGLQAADDALYLRRYDYTERPEETTTLFEIDQRILINQVYLAGRGESYYTDVSTLRFQRLTEDFDNDTLPIVGPLVRMDADVPLPRGLGDLDLDFNAVNIRRELGRDHIRASAGFEWSAPTTLPFGVRVEPFLLGRVDGYSFNTTDRDGAELERTNFTRTLGATGLDVSWPFLRPGERFDVIFAPRIFTVAATGVDDDEIPLAAENETSDLDSSTLFRANRVGGYDLWEDGARVDLGLTTTFEGRGAFEPLRLEGFAGRSYRLDGEPRLSRASGVFEDESDWVAELEISSSIARIAARTRIDTETGDMNRLDLTGAVSAWRLDLGATYTDIADPAAPRAFEELKANAEFHITGNWSATWNTVRDIEDGRTRTTSAGLRYRDECTDFRIFWQREDLDIGDLGPSESIKFEIVLFTLGGVGEE
jgi:LPS-assembly protein